MKRKLLAMAILMAVLGSGKPLHAQFNTVVDKRSESYELISNRSLESQVVDSKINNVVESSACQYDSILTSRDKEVLKIESKEPVRKKHLDLFKRYDELPGLTINNLLLEIRKNGIQHEKVVLAQAILETGWFTSSVCRNKNNLFGLTNPRTGQYYEFNHWTESVKAYYTKVQYRYKGGNYLLWLDEIGYAENKTYVQLLIKLLNQYFI